MTARRANRVDQNQPSIVAALRRLPGVVVQSLAPVGDGVPDLMVSVAGLNLLLEVKVPNESPRAKRRWLLTPDQEAWHRAWTGQVAVVCTPEEAVSVVLNAMEERAA